MGGLFEGFKFIFRGGFMMLPLLASSLIALTVIIERWKALNKQYVTPPDFTQEVLEKVQEGKTAEALKLCDGKVHSGGGGVKGRLGAFQEPVGGNGNRHEERGGKLGAAPGKKGPCFGYHHHHRSLDGTAREPSSA